VTYLFTSESVTSGHPDKLCDFISDSILDACIELDPNARVAVEVFVKGLRGQNNEKIKSYIIIGGEITMNSEFNVDYEKIARNCAIEVGYSDLEIGMDASDIESCEVLILISRQSEEISQGVSEGLGIDMSQGAGDQGIIFGYATNESEEIETTTGSYMPLPIILAHKLTLEITKQRLNGDLEWARPDGKSQVTIEYDENGKPLKVDTIVIAIQHDDMIGSRFKDKFSEHKFIVNEVKEKIIKKIVPKELVNEDMKLIVNGTGRFCTGGPYADAGLTGRKIIVDTYGGSGRHGGGAFSGKDPSKVDRSAAYYARWVTKHIVASGLADKCEIQIAYSIGVAKPISINLNVDTFGTSDLNNEAIKNIVLNKFDFRPASIISQLKLRNSIYSKTTSGGHFGREGKEKYFSWEILDQELLNSLVDLAPK